MMFIGLYIFISVIFLFFSVISFCTFSLIHKRKADLYLGLFFLFMFFSYAVYSISKGFLVGGSQFTDILGYIADTCAVIVIIISIISNIKNNKEFYKKVLFKNK